MKPRQLDILNIGLLLLSLVIAYQVPFGLFLIVYAFLGPLHYLTEINWLQRKKFFSGDARWGWVAVLFSVLIVLPKFWVLPPWNEALTPHGVPEFVVWMQTNSNTFVLAWLLASAGLILTKKIWVPIALGALGGVLGSLWWDVRFYQMVVGLLIPTVAHVYLFTLLFMVYGTLKSSSKPGWLAAALMVAVPLFIAFWPISPDSYQITELEKEIFTGNRFHITNVKMAEFFGWSDGKTFFFYEALVLKLQVFIAFAYTYHYLNWFSKTTVIGWHKQLTTGRTIAIAATWIASCALFVYDYQMGFLLLLGLSFLHVLMEFPLNALSVKGIVQAIGGKG